MSSAPPTRTQQALIYFGLAEDPRRTTASIEAGGVERAVRPVDLWVIAILPVFMVNLAWQDRGAVAGLAVAALFAPAIAIGIGPGPLKRFRERAPDVARLLAVPGIMLAGTLYLVPDASAIWIPIVVATAATALVLALDSRSTAK